MNTDAQTIGSEPGVSLESITHEVVFITPEVAASWVGDEVNWHNRSISKAKVVGWARTMHEGAWAFNGDAIRFGTDAEGKEVLLDGQHRLAACVLAGVGFTTLVVRGLPVSAQDTMDRGRGRSYADRLKLNGEVYPDTLSALLRRLILWEWGQYVYNPRTQVPTDLDMDRALERHAGLRASAHYGTTHSGRSSVRPSIMAFLHWLLTAQSPEVGTEFLDRLSDGASLDPGSPILVVRERLRKERESATTRGVPTETVIALVITAWNLYCTNQTVVKIQLPKGGLSNDTYPMPRKPRR